MSKERQSNFELLRVMAMLMIVISHFAVHGTYEAPAYTTPEQWALNILQIGGKLGSNLFVMISAYFMVDKRFKIERVMSIILQVWLYSLLILAGSYLLGSGPGRHFSNSIVPFPVAYWFATSYLLLLLVAPVLNHLIVVISQKSLMYLLWFLTVVWIILPNLGLNAIPVSNFMWFAYLYLMVAWIKRYPIPIIKSQNRWKSMSKKVFSFILITIIWFHILSQYDASALANTTNQLAQNSILTVLLSFSLFLWTKNSHKFSISYLNKLATYTFPVYLLHEHPLMREWIWNLVDNQRILGFFPMLILGILYGILVYSISTIVALVVQPLVDVISRKIGLFLIMQINPLIDGWRNIVNNVEQSKIEEE